MNEDWNVTIRGIVAVPSGFGSRLLYVDLQGSKRKYCRIAVSVGIIAT